MCEFKNCAGAHVCLLRKTSPCPDSFPDERKAVDKVGRLGLSGKGFLDRDDLIASLKLDKILAENRFSADVVGIAHFRRSDAERFAS